ncbi:PD-(D/E)XK nuclease family protein [Spirosoma koreense]
MPINYRFYPSLLNVFSRYLQGGNFSMQELIDSINRIPTPTTVAQERGISFEEAIVKGTDEARFDPAIIAKVRKLLPRPIVDTQVYCQWEIDDVLFYGYVDLIGKFKAVDLKTTSSYQPGRYVHNHQNLYLHALKRKGIKLMEYVITDFKEVYVESYALTHPIEKQLEEIRLFKAFLEEHRPLITDAKIFVTPGADPDARRRPA